MLSRYRPLSKYIGLYQTYKYNKGTFRRLFPSPLEVDRFISGQRIGAKLNNEFPSPLEVDRFISNDRASCQRAYN